MKNTILSLTLLIGLFTTLNTVIADEQKKTIIIKETVARETPPGTSVGAGYLTITNTGAEDDVLIAASGNLAPVIQIHTMSIVDNVMTMQEIQGGLVIPAGQSVQLKPGGKHLMFMNLPEQLKAGEQHKVTLTFKKAGTIEVVFDVKKHDASSHGHSQHGHGKHTPEKKTKHHHH